MGKFLSDEGYLMVCIFPTVIIKLDGLFEDMAKLPNIDGKAITHDQRFVHRHNTIVGIQARKAGL